MPQTRYDAIYLSPHLDDAALSCGAQIFSRYQAGDTILIVTLMAGDPPPETPHSAFADSLHSRWELAQDVVAQRRAEDIAACQLLGAEYQHWSIPDCIYRADPQTGAMLYQSEAEIFGDVTLAERPLVAQLADQIAALPPHRELFIPLTVGHHVDHLLTRLAAEQVYQAGGAKGPLYYYEDYPYVGDPAALHQVIGREADGWQAKIWPVAETAVAARIAAIAAFASQVSTFFRDHADLTRQIHQHIQQVGGERIWQRIAHLPD